MGLFSLSTILPNGETVRRNTSWICGLFHATGLGRFFLKRGRRRGRIPILLYHSIGEATEAAVSHTCFMAMGLVVENRRFEAQMNYLSHNATVLGLDEVAASLRNGNQLPSDSVVLTFDDGFRDAFTAVVPILRTYRFRATFFPIGSFVNSSGLPWPYALYRLLDAMQSKPFRIDISGFPRTSGKRLGENSKLRLARQLRQFLELLPAEERNAAIVKLCEVNGLPAELLRCRGLFMTDVDLRAIIAEGHLVGGHSMSHCNLTALSPAKSGDEAALTKEFIGSYGGSSFASFAYPFGNHDSAVRDILRHREFDCAVTTSEGLNDRKTDLFALRRIYIGNFNVAEFETHLSGAVAPLLRLARGLY
jgi:peptidoglycan/xylan/chitin deacetylase (PgdA/CDA1 family)